MSNEYSAAWFALFIDPIAGTQTDAEIGFLERQLPLPAYRSVLDLCCGVGRHARPLAARGYQVTGLDRSAAALAGARACGEAGIVYRQADMRDLAALPGTFDAVVCLWQSFGYFDAAANTVLLRRIHAKLRSQGRLILDLYHREFFEQHQGERLFERNGQIIREQKHMAGNRLVVHLDYGPGEPGDAFDWQLYTPVELATLGEQTGFRPLLACCGFREEQPATAAEPRMQLVFEKMDAEGDSRYGYP